MIDIFIPAASTILIFIAFALNAHRNNYDFVDKLVELFLQSFGLSLSLVLAMSLILYSLDVQFMGGLTDQELQLGLFLAGAVC